MVNKPQIQKSDEDVAKSSEIMENGEVSDPEGKQFLERQKYHSFNVQNFSRKGRSNERFIP